MTSPDRCTRQNRCKQDWLRSRDNSPHQFKGFCRWQPDLVSSHDRDSSYARDTSRMWRRAKFIDITLEGLLFDRHAPANIDVNRWKKRLARLPRTLRGGGDFKEPDFVWAEVGRVAPGGHHDRVISAGVIPIVVAGVMGEHQRRAYALDYRPDSAG